MTASISILQQSFSQLIKRHRNTSSDRHLETIPTQSVRLSAERDGRETLPATVRHDRVEDPPGTTLELAAGIGLIQSAIPCLGQRASRGAPDVPDGFHYAQCDATAPRKLRTLVQKIGQLFDQDAQQPSRCVQFLLR
jgi:hypothetical protein